VRTTDTSEVDMRSRAYVITVRGRLSERFAAAFERTRIEPESGARTRLITESFDQTQLRGLLDRLSDFGLELVRVEELAS
jgi:hypothetical protein